MIMRLSLMLVCMVMFQMSAVCVVFVMHSLSIQSVCIFCKLVAKNDTICEMTSVDQFARTLKEHGQSITKPRRVLFAALQNQEPLTIAQLIDRCSEIDRASIYRTIALFEKVGIIQRLQTGWKYRLELTDAFHDHHHHASCTMCGRVITLPEDTELEELLHRLADKHDFTIQSHQLELQGICANCRVGQPF
jgi:Fur family transcriptional regulator, ferric uptake regulator